MTNVLLVPMRMDALWLSQQQAIGGASADFSRLPHRDGSQLVNANVPWLSDSVLAQPLTAQDTMLPAGIHLHWALPDGLTRAWHVHGTKHKLSFPPAPNRWLVTRTLAYGQPPQQQWLIESDYLHPPFTAAPAGERSCIPFVTNAPNAGTCPFRFMGRTRTFDASWSEEPQAESLARHGFRLTAVGYEPHDADTGLTGGYGEPMFAAYYPNCRGVFGFHDPQATDRLPGISYEVIGWYSDPHLDCLQSRQFYEALGALVAVKTGGIDAPLLSWKALRFAVNKVLPHLRQAFEEHFQWQVPQDGRFPEQSICFARLRLAGHLQAPKVTGYRDPAKVSIAIGNTATEALSAYLARKLDTPPLPRVQRPTEEQLEALHLLPTIEGKQVDVHAKLCEARHEKGFSAASGGHIWSIRSQRVADTEPVPDESISVDDALPAQLAAQLAALNDAQGALDRTQDELKFLQRRAGIDWHHYLNWKYPADGVHQDSPTLDELRRFITAHDLVPIEQRKAALDPLEEQRDEMHRQLAESLATLGDVNKRSYLLKEHAAPRFWQPRDPVMMVIGDVVEPTDRHDAEGLLNCKIVTIADSDLRTRLGAILAAIRSIGANEAITGSTEWCRQPWNPIALDWEVEMLVPMRIASRAKFETAPYRADYIGSRYKLVGTDLAGQFSVSHLPSRDPALVYASQDRRQGRSLLGAHAKRSLTKRITELVDRATSGGTTTQPWFASLQAQLGEQWHAQTLTLSGFNEALLMHRQCMQLPIADPLGDATATSFAARTDQAVEKRNRSSPQPCRSFSPIRAGQFRFLRLRLLDTFGQVQELAWDREPLVAEPLAWPDGGEFINLPPRILQPARLNFRWLSAAGQANTVADEQEMNTHPGTTPLCGWIVRCELEEERLFVYDAAGTLLGLLFAPDGQRCTWVDPPGDIAAATEHIDNVHLRGVIEHLLQQPSATLKQLIDAIDDSIDNIQPEQFAQHSAPALMFARPLAIVRATVDLQLRDPLATKLGWDVLRQMTEEFGKGASNYASDPLAGPTDDFEHVLWPVRLGEPAQLNDGLVGYWIENPSPPGAQRYANQPFITVGDDDSAQPLALTLNQPPLAVTMLMDPRAPVHATCGVVPTKAIAVPPSHFVRALEAFSIAFFCDPLLLPPGPVAMELPTPAGYQWSFWSKDPASGEWSARQVVSTPAPIDFSAPAELVNGWFRLSRQ